MDGVLVLQPGCNVGARYSAPTNITKSAEINVYPNPFNDFVTLDFINGVEQSKLSISVFNYMGQKVQEKNLNVATETPFNQQVDLGTYPSGIYFINVNTNDKVQTFKVIKQ